MNLDDRATHLARHLDSQGRCVLVQDLPPSLDSPKIILGKGPAGLTPNSYLTTYFLSNNSTNKSLM